MEKEKYKKKFVEVRSICDQCQGLRFGHKYWYCCESPLYSQELSILVKKEFKDYNVMKRIKKNQQKKRELDMEKLIA